MVASTSSNTFLKHFAKKIATAPALRPLGRPLLHAAQYTLALHHIETVYFGQPERAKHAERVREIVTSWPTQTMGVDEAYMIRAAVLQTAKVEGDIAEVGVYRGGTARIICEAKGNRPLHLFDTFEGLPEPGEIDSAFRRGEYACSLESVRQYLKGFADVRFYKGLFPGTAEPAKLHKFSFVHLDVDLYESTMAALDFFYPRMDPGAVIISHDYVTFPGVRAAFDQFFEKKPEPVVELTGNQCLVVKVAPCS